MYTLYWSPISASMAPHAALEEVAADYELRRVDLDKPREAAYLAINPTGKVPTLVVGDSLVVCETAAILMYLADRHPEAALAPTLTDPLRPAYYQWMCYLTNTLQDAFLPWYYPERYSGVPSHADAIKRKAEETLHGIWQRIERHLERNGPYLLGDRFSTCDLMLFMFTEWRDPHPDLLERYKTVARLARMLCERPSIMKMMSLQKAA
jgi:glutathione S-transferase